MDSNGKERTRWGDTVDDSFSGLLFFDAAGGYRAGIGYDPTTALFNGFSTADGSGHTLAVLGNALATSGILAPNDSFMDLSDTSGTERVFEFQNSTNEGGIDFNPGSTTVQGGWGNP